MGGGLMRRGSCARAVCPLVSVSTTTTFAVPLCVGFPEIAFAFALKPAGSPVMLHVYGDCPPPAAIRAAYGVPTVPFARLDVVMTSVGMIFKLSVALALCWLESFSVTCTVKAPLCVGLPV